jgi:hypothetical protein
MAPVNGALNGSSNGAAKSPVKGSVNGSSNGSSNGKQPAPAGKVPVIRGDRGKPAGVNGTTPENSAEHPESPAASLERTAIIIKRVPPAAKPTRAPEAATYRSANAQGETNGNDHDAEAAETNGDSDASPSDVRVVLQPKRVGGENGGKAR